MLVVGRYLPTGGGPASDFGADYLCFLLFTFHLHLRSTIPHNLPYFDQVDSLQIPT
jgi:hypothetical protein